MNIYRKLGLPELINAEGTITRLGGCIMAPAVVEAMAALVLVDCALRQSCYGVI